MTKSAERRLPLFYLDPRPLAPAPHQDVRLNGDGYGFARATNAVPLAVIEFASAMRHYPVVFAEGDDFPIALFGLDETNRFVDGERWAAGHYVPAYIRRYPFVFVETADDSFALALDMGSDRVVRGGTEGTALFEDGKPSALTEDAMAFCRDFHGAYLQTCAFAHALVEQDLLVPQTADARLASGKPMMLAGFKVVDRARFEALSDELILGWHKRGWLSLIHFHFASLDRFTDLLARETDVQPAPSVSEKEDA